MVKLPTVFDPTKFTPSTGGGSLPVSDAKGHRVIIVDSDIKDASTGNGWYLELMLRIIEGPLTGTEGPLRINLGNHTASTVEIALKQMSAVCLACGYIEEVEDVSVLYNRPFVVIVVPQVDKETGLPSDKGYTNISQILDMNGGRPKLPSANDLPVAPIEAAPKGWSAPVAPLSKPAAVPALAGAPWGAKA